MSRCASGRRSTVCCHSSEEERRCPKPKTIVRIDLATCGVGKQYSVGLISQRPPVQIRPPLPAQRSSMAEGPFHTRVIASSILAAAIHVEFEHHLHQTHERLA